MRIAGLPPAMQQGLLTALTQVGDRFAVASASGEAAQAAAAVTTVPTATHPHISAELLVAIAATEPEIDRRRKQAESAERAVTLLERLHAELVEGTLAPERVQELADWAAAFEVPDDPQIAALAREIELRVRVEVAKHELRV